MKTFFIADPHFGHKAIMEYEGRPFETVKEMDDVTAAIVKRLKGMKYLILGNHDNPNVKRYYEMGFHRVYDYPIILDGFWMLSHEPLYTNVNMPYGNIFGHVHANKQYTDYSKQSFCVSVERISYTPIEFDEIKRLMGVGGTEEDGFNRQ